MKTDQFFKVGKNNIGYVGNDFKKHFSGMTIGPSSKKLFSKTLKKPMTDAEILNELNPHSVSLGDVANFIKTAPKEREGIFYVKDKDGILLEVSVGWRAFYGRWGVGADSVEDPDVWLAGSQVFSRNPFYSQKTPSSLDGKTITIDGIGYKLNRIKN